VNDEPDFVVIGLLGRARGVGGEIFVRPVTDMPERFHRLDRALLRQNGRIREIEIDAVKTQGDSLILKLEGIDTRSDARSLNGAELGVRRDNVWPVPEGTYYVFDLVGCKVVGVAGREIGMIRDVLKMPANDVLVVMSGSKECLIPAVKSVVKEVDLEQKLVTIEEMEGLLE
jgi:16S rRNA processing protein RimM